MELTNQDGISAFDMLRQRMGTPVTFIPTSSPESSIRWTIRMFDALKKHWPEYLMEAAELGLFMFSACAFTVLLYHPSSPVAQTIHDDALRRLMMGTAMGSSAIAIIFSPLGQRSGAHFNPSVTWTFFRLGKIGAWDAAFYTLFQFAGGIAGVMLASLTLHTLVAHQSVNYAVTLPGSNGPLVALFAEIIISFILMSVVLTVSNTKRLARWTGMFAGVLVATYITIESPISGMSMNPARTFSSAVAAQVWMSLWIYFVAPPVGMLLAAEVYRRLNTGRSVACAKLHHHNNKRCIFRCNIEAEQ
ncbi:MAG TPA: aquaporin [Pyrinomonadaceae bacterium]|nr:aquaporin [Pyrinomonadaceae bacterium]